MDQFSSEIPKKKMLKELRREVGGKLCVYEDEEREGGRREGGIQLILSSIYHSREQRPAVHPTLRCDK